MFNLILLEIQLDFGDMMFNEPNQLVSSSEIRGLFSWWILFKIVMIIDNIDYFTIASEGNSIDFGNLTVWKVLRAGCSSSSRGLLVVILHQITLLIQLTLLKYQLWNALDFGDTVKEVKLGTGFASPDSWYFFLDLLNLKQDNYRIQYDCIKR